MKEITIIMPFLNEENEPDNTVESIYSTANPKNFDIIAINDGSDQNYDYFQNKFKEITYIQNKGRIGVDACRQMGVDLAKTPYIFIIDAHMRFPNGWMDNILQFAYKEPKTFWCTTSLALGYGNMDLGKARDRYYGASLLFVNKNTNKPAREILEPKWTSKKSNDPAYEIPCILGANYAFSKQWFDYLHGLKGLRMWGTSEPFLSLKSWMAGGKCKLITGVEIGHKFRDSAPYSTGVWNMIYNKLYLCKTILPKDVASRLIGYFNNDTNFSRAMREIKSQNICIENEKKYYDGIFNVKLEDFCKKFDIAVP